LHLQKIRRISRILASTKNQADLRNPCADKKSCRFKKSLRLQKIRRIYRILASTENQADDRILAGVEIPAPGKKTRAWRKTSETGKTGGPLTV
jgi:hypothetical protein